MQYWALPSLKLTIPAEGEMNPGTNLGNGGGGNGACLTNIGRIGFSWKLEMRIVSGASSLWHRIEIKA